MKFTTSTRNILYTGLVLFCAAFAVVIFVNGKSKNTFPTLKERTGALAQASEWAETQATYNKLIAELEAKPGDARNTLKLAKTFMNEGRATGDFTYYNKCALDLIETVLAKDPKDFEAIALKSMIFLSQHRFAEGKAIAEEAMRSNPHNSFVYGLLVDANVELGDYATAVDMCDKMVSIRPDIRSYSRISYLRELHGEMAAAIEAIQQAIAAGMPGREDTEWARMVLAHLYEDSNQLDKAEEQYMLSLQHRPDYPFALAGLGRIARFKKDYATAVSYFEKASGVMNDVSFFEELAEIYRLNGQEDKAAKCTRITTEALLADNISAKKDKNLGHNANYELAILYLKNNNPKAAVEFARAEYQSRPQNMDACETFAWALYQNGQYAEAAQHVSTMLRTNSQKPERLVRAGIILAANGQNEEGKLLIAKGLNLKPYMDETLVKSAETIING
jgi:tetratricopeptide (TPR) repeat protein